MKRTGMGVRILCATLALAPKAYATNSIGFNVTGGKGTSGYDTSGAFDWKSPLDENPFVLSLSYAHLSSTRNTPSRTEQFTGGVEHAFTDNWEAYLDVTHVKDAINAVHFTGPTMGVTYTWTRAEGAARSAAASDKSSADYQLIDPEDVSKAPSDKNETGTTPASKDEIASLSLNVDYFFYGTDVITSSVTRTVRNPKTQRLVTRVIPPSTTTENVRQFHPSLTFEKPLFDSQATPYITAGHYFYNKDVAAIEALAGRPRFSASANQINGLVGGFLKNNGEIGMRIELPWDVNSDVRLGAEQEVTDNSWATTQGVTFSRLFFTHIKAKIDWSRAIQSGIADDLFSGGLTYIF